MNNKNQTWALELAKQFAPKIFFHRNEEFMPSSAEWFLERCNLISATGAIIKKVNPKSLEENNFPTTKLALKGTTSRTGFLDQAKVYVHLRNAPRTEVKSTLLYDIQYWVFSPYNGRVFGNLGKHEGDWEHITIRLKDVFTNPCITRVFYSSHGGGKWAIPDSTLTNPTRDRAYLDEDGRVWAFSAKNTHAFYESPGKFLRIVIPDDKTTYGLEWNTQCQLQIISDNLTDQHRYFIENNKVPDLTYNSKNICPIENHWWLFFRGTWGKDNNSPIGPLYKTAWDKSNSKGKDPI